MLVERGILLATYNMIDVNRSFELSRPVMLEARHSTNPIKVSELMLLPTILSLSKIVGTFSNYSNHVLEMGGLADLPSERLMR